MSSIIKFFDDMEVGNFLWLSLAFVILFVPGFVIGFVMPGVEWIIIVAAVVAGLFVIWCVIYILVNWQEWRVEKEILAATKKHHLPFQIIGETGGDSLIVDDHCTLSLASIETERKKFFERL